eukprot:5450718-Alexandrium_andersonii.AAC.1
MVGDPCSRPVFGNSESLLSSVFPGCPSGMCRAAVQIRSMRRPLGAQRPRPELPDLPIANWHQTPEVQTALP